MKPRNSVPYKLGTPLDEPNQNTTALLKREKKTYFNFKFPPISMAQRHPASYNGEFATVRVMLILHKLIQCRFCAAVSVLLFVKEVFIEAE
jgi:hypothetical protein